jgi:hypothetical protein
MANLFSLKYFNLHSYIWSLLIAGFVLLTLLISFGASFLIFVCGLFGLHEFKISQNWHINKINKLKAGTPKKDLKEDLGLMKRYGLFVYIPLIAYSLLVYSAYGFAQGDTTFTKILMSYFDSHQNLHRLSSSLYPTIETHYDAVVQKEPLRAETLRHIYAIIFNAIIIAPLSLALSLPAWVKHAYCFELRGYSKKFCLSSAIFVVIVLYITNLLFYYYIDADTFRVSRRLSYDVLVNEKFLQQILMFTYIFFINCSYILIVGIAYIICLFKAPFNSKST